jgi:hypothetical protein
LRAFDIARELFSRERIAERIAAVREAEAQVQRCEAEHRAAEVQVPWWERAAFFHDTAREVAADEARGRLVAARARLGQARAEQDEAVRELGAEVPFVPLLFRIESIVSALVADGSIGRTLSSGTGAARELDSIADEVFALWAPGVDVSRLVARLRADEPNPDERALGPVATDDRRVWKPVDADECYQRTRQAALARGELARAREELGEATLERDRVRAHLVSLERQAGVFGRVIESGDHRRPLADASAALSIEEQRVFDAVDGIHLAVARAMCAHPPVWIGLAARAASAALRAVHDAFEWTVGSSGEFVRVPSAYMRAAVLRASSSYARRATSRSTGSRPSSGPAGAARRRGSG